MVINLNGCINLVTAKQNAKIVKMVLEGVISSKQAKELLTIVIEENIKNIKNYISQR